LLSHLKQHDDGGGKNMSKKLFTMLGLSCVITFILVACGNTGANANATSNNVHMNSTNFVQTSITLKKGESVTLINDELTPHIIANGTWENGAAKSEREPNAPEIRDMQINGNDSGTIGPFTSAGTFKLYCTIHPGMNLTIVVQ
jgi:plastocyanin